MSGIFSRIFRYRQSEHRAPSEDYFTETFVAVLERCEPLRIAFVEWLIGPMNIKRENIEAVRIETQKWFTDGGIIRRPDIWVEARDSAEKRHVAIIENKIDSHQGENQLSDYARILEGEQGAVSRMLVYITKYAEEPDFRDRENIRFEHRKWFEVYDNLAKEHQKATESVGDLPGELLRLMEDWNMDGTLSAAHLRAAVTCIGARVGQRLHAIQNEAWHASGIGEFLDNMWMPGNWRYEYEIGAQTSSPIQDYGVRLWMGFRFDRRDADWDVDKLELPSPAVTLYPQGAGGQELPQRPENWAGPVEGMSEHDLWVRQPIQCEKPCHGDPLAEYYRDFFRDAFTELKEALEGGQ